MINRTLRYLILAIPVFAIIAITTAYTGSSPDWRTNPAEAQSAACLITQKGEPDTQIALVSTDSDALVLNTPNQFHLTGSFAGTVTILPGTGAAVSTSEADLTCNRSGSRIFVDKNASSVPIWVERCSTRDHIRITSRQPATCILLESYGKSTSRPPRPVSWLTRQDQTKTTAPIGNGDDDSNQTPPDSTTTTNPTPVTTTPVTKPPTTIPSGNLHAPTALLNLNENSPPCNTTGQLDPSLALRTITADDHGPKSLDISWTTHISLLPYSFCITLEHELAFAVPTGVEHLPDTGFIAGWHETWKSRGHYWTHRATIGGDDLPGMYPGGTYLVHIQALEANGDYGPRITARASTNPLTTLGPVRNARVWEERQSRVGIVLLSWNAGDGHPSTLDLQKGENVLIDWRKQGQEYSPDRTSQGYSYNGSQIRGPLFRAFLPRRLNPDTEYTFRFIPTKDNLTDGPPVEVTYRTRRLEAPPAPTITAITFGVWMDLYIDLSVGMDGLMMYVRSGTDSQRLITKGGSYSYIKRVNIPYLYQENCVMLAGIVGTGEDAIEGPKSEEFCATHERPQSP